ncbi:MAG: photosynthetic reaction centre cytochrome c subunit [Candidatus Acidoferrum typicum]|nr:photosynthetic reaction centre cytochrome c subunit [Candidatus Acidoferrum typicum]
MANLGSWKWTALSIVLFAAGPADGQFPDKFTNLKVLPKDISKHELESTMRGFAFALGVRCDHCHVEKKAPEHGLDFASDDKDEKKTARIMLQMVAGINHDYISKVPKETPNVEPIQVQCVTCHHGLTHPRTLTAVLSESLEKNGLEKTLALYGELRKKYYGSGQYDFGETSLNQLTEALLAKKENSQALAIMELNFSANHPDSAWSYHVLAQTHEANGQIDKAIADYRKALELHPDDRWAQQQIDSLSKTK